VSDDDWCAVPRCREKAGLTWLGLRVCWKCFGRHCDRADGFSLKKKLRRQLAAQNQTEVCYYG